MRGGVLLLWCGVSAAALAHVGAPDVIHEGHAGPYKLLVSVSPPDVIPGVAQVEVETHDRDLAELKILSMPLSGDGARFPPAADVAERIPGMPLRFTSKLWLMSPGAWQVHLAADGPRGTGELAVPVPALPSQTRSMNWGLGLGLAALMLLLVMGAASIVGAGTAEGQLNPGDAPDENRRRKARWARGTTLVVLAVALVGANQWWSAEAAQYRHNIYKPVRMTAAVVDGELELSLADPGWLKGRRTDDWVADHGHLMHLYMLSEPAFDRVWHLHPEPVAPDVFHHPLPPGLPKGKYRLFADVVHATGLAETATAEVELDAATGAPLLPDDAEGAGPPLGEGDANRRAAPLTPGRIIWLNSNAFEAGRLVWLRFRVEDGPAQPTEELEPYMGMLGHAAIIRDDGSVFAHIHPTGSVPMASLMVAGASEADHVAAAAPSGPNKSEVGFPFRFPKPGLYRVVVQVKRRGVIETGLFTARVGTAALNSP